MTLPAPVRAVMETLHQQGFAAFLVGGCLRDHLLGREPEDFDIATAARPDQVLALFPRAVPTGIRFGTVTVVVAGQPIEVTTFRADGDYRDGRHPDQVVFGTHIAADLARRDFTINAMAWSPETGLVDPNGGADHLRQRLVAAVGAPEERFREDALRMLRAIRFAASLDFRLDTATQAAIAQHAALLDRVAAERVRDELDGILLSQRADHGLELLAVTCLLPVFLPELARGVGFAQHHPRHRFDVYTHTCAVVAGLPPRLHLRLAGLLHDVAKPETFTLGADGVGHFYGHQQVGAAVTEQILKRLKYDGETRRRVPLLVQEHMFSSRMGPRARRRFIARVGAANIPDLLALRLADMVGSGTAFDDRHVTELAAELARMEAEGVAAPARALAINGHDVMAALGWPPGPRVGAVLKVLQLRIVDDPLLNQRPVLLGLLPEVAREA